MPLSVIVGGGALVALLAGLWAIIWMAHRDGAAAQAAADATKTNGATDAMLQAATHDGHDPSALDRSLRDHSF